MAEKKGFRFNLSFFMSIFMVCSMLLGNFSQVLAQDANSPTPEATEVATTETPTEVVPTVEPTENINVTPTEVFTDTPSSDYSTPISSNPDSQSNTPNIQSAEYKTDFFHYDSLMASDQDTLSAQSYGGTIRVYGYWYYLDKNSSSQPIRGARVEIWESDLLGDQLLATTYSDNYGYYSHTVSNVDTYGENGRDIYVKVFSTDDFSVTVKPLTLIPSSYVFTSAITSDVNDGDFYTGSTLIDDPKLREVFYIYDKVANDAFYFMWQLGWTNNYNLKIKWDPDRADAETEYTIGGDLEISALNGWDEDAFFHEYGHFIMDKAYVNLSPSGEQHTWGVHNSLETAWIEGWADFIQGAIQNHEDYIDTALGHHFHMEGPSREDNEYPTLDHPEDEAAVAAALWDIYDPANEPQDQISDGMKEIWKIVSEGQPTTILNFYFYWAANHNGDTCLVAPIFQYLLIDVASSCETPAFTNTSPQNIATEQPLDTLLSWSDLPEALSYEYCIDTTNNDICDTGWVNNGLNTSVAPVGLVNNTTYFWQVRGTNINGTIYANNNLWSSFSTVNNGLGCSAPALINPVDKYSSKNSAFTFNWSPITGCTFTGYLFRIKDTSNMEGGGSTIVDKVVSETSTSVIIGDQWKDEILYWGVKAANAPESSAWSVRVFKNGEMANSLSNLSSGYDFSCAITITGGVKCWGNNSSGRLGDGTSTELSTIPVNVIGLSTGVVAISSGSYHTCALTSEGGVKCWGYNGYYQLGDTTNTNRNYPVDLVELNEKAIAISAGDFYNCVLTSSGGVKCWGRNDYGQLGDGTTVDKMKPVDVVGLSSGVVAISAGYAHSCALLDTGGVKCWGMNTDGQIGDGTTVSRTTPVDVFGLNKGIVSISAGGFHTCALNENWEAKCWGRNDHGQLGDGSAINKYTPVSISGFPNGVTAIDIRRFSTCGLTPSGGVKCWGQNFSGQLGDGTTIDQLLPVDVLTLSSGVNAIAMGELQACAMTEEHGVKCWGNNYYGQLGNESTNDSLSPVKVNDLGPYVDPGLTIKSFTPAISFAGDSSFTLTVNGTDFVNGSTISWDNKTLETSYIDSHTLTAIVPASYLTDAGVFPLIVKNSLLDGNSSIISYYHVIDKSSRVVSIGDYFSCLVSPESGAKCWGDNNYGQLGDGTKKYSSIPVGVTGLSTGVAATAPGLWHACALTTSGGVKCWGSNSWGVVGDGTTTSGYTPPVDVVGLSSGALAISAGDDHTCVITSSGGIKCWGLNHEGALGDGTTTARYIPVDVLGLSGGVVSIAVGDDHNCALNIDGGVKCWGSITMGQLGDGSWESTGINFRKTPVDVVGLSSGVIGISVGNEHSCAVTTSGAVKCWGSNSLGQLGNGSGGDLWDHSAIPVDVTGLSNGVVSVSSGYSHNCVLTSTGGVKCWGLNGSGQLGDGTTATRLTPVDVVGLSSGVLAVSSGSYGSCAVTKAGGIKCWGAGFGTTPRFVTGFEGRYSIAGFVLSSGGKPVQGVTISDDSGISAMTDISGRYELPSLKIGLYNLTATKIGYSFNPTSQAVNLQTDTTGIDFEMITEPPIITGISPSIVPSGTSAFTLLINGSKFTDKSMVEINGVDRETTFISDTKLSVYIDALEVKNAISDVITVINPDPAGDLSNSALLSIIDVLPEDGQKISLPKVTFGWGDISGATKYNIQLSLSENFSSTQLNTTVNSPSYAYGTALTNGKAYYWRIQPVYGTLKGDWSPTFTFYSMTPPTAPVLSSPAGASFINDSTPEFSWAAATNAVKYEIQLSKSSAFTAMVNDVTLDEGVLSYTADVLPDGPYYWRVRGIDDVGALGSWSASRNFTVDTAAPSIPQLSSPLDSVTVRGTPKYTWLAAAGAKYYQFSYGGTGDCNDAGYTPIYTSGELTTLYTIPPLQAINDPTTPGYYWCVRSKDAAGNWSAWSAARKITIISVVPAAPALIAPTTGTYTNDTTPDLSWKSVPYGVTYEIRMSRAYTFSSILEEPLPAEGELSVNAATFGDGKYYWQVRAVNREGEKSAWSAYRYFTLDTTAQAAPKPSAPLDGAVVQTTIPKLAVGLVSGAKYYQFQVSADDTFTTTLLDVTKPTYYYTLLKTEALPFGTLYWRARDIDAAGNASEWSVTRSFVVNILKTPKVDSYTLDTTPTFSWAAAASALEYRIQVDTKEDFSSPMPVIDINRVPSTSYTPTTVLAHNIYYWRMQVRTAEGWGNWTPVQKFIVTPTPPVAPVLLAPVSGLRSDNSTQTFSWNPVSTGNYYEIQVSASQYFTTLENDAVLEPGLLEYTVTLLKDGRHYWRVRAFNELGVPGTWSAARYFNKIITAPVVVSPVSTDITSSLRPVFDWEDVSGAGKYSIQLSNSETFSTILMSGTPLSSTFTPGADLPANTVLYWRVQALGTNGPSFWASQSFTTGNPPSIPVPDFPVNVNLSSYEPELAWKASTGDPVYYQIQAAKDKAFTTLVVEANITGTSYQVPSGILEDLTVYYWRVRSVNTLEQASSWSAPAWMRSPGTVSGKVTDAVTGLGVGGVLVTIKGTALSGTTDMDGMYSIKGIKPGYYTLLPSDTNYSFAPSSMVFTLSTVNLTGKNFKATEYLSVSGKVVLDPRAALMAQSAASLSTAFSENDADVTMYESDPAAEVVSGVVVKDNQGNAVLTDANGEYTIDDAKAGNYSLNLTKSGYSAIPIKRSFYLSDDAMSQYFMIAPPAEPSTIQIIHNFYADLNHYASFSANGRFVVIPGQTGEEGQIIDIYTGAITTGIGLKPEISGDGRYVVFYSWHQLTPDDLNDRPDVFVLDRDIDGNGIFDEIGNTELWRASKMSDISQYNENYRDAGSPYISADGTQIVFQSGRSTSFDIGSNNPGSCGNFFTYDIATRTTKCPNLPQSATITSISSTGRYVGFDMSDGQAYVYDRDPDGDGVFDTGALWLDKVSTTTSGVDSVRVQYGNAISADGRFAVFPADGLGNIDNGNFRNIYLRDRTARTTTVITRKTLVNGCLSYLDPYSPKITPDGRYIFFVAAVYIPKDTCGNTNGYDIQNGWHAFIYDRDIDQDGIFDEIGSIKLSVVNTLLTHTSVSLVYSGNISADGRYLLLTDKTSDFESGGIFLHDRGTNLSFSITGRVTNGNGEPVPGISIDAGNGRLAFSDQDGYYSFLGLPGGTYYLTPSDGETTFSPSVRAVVVPPSSTGQDFTVTSGYQEYSSLSGRIADAYNTPIPGVTVDDNNGHQAITDEQGSYAFNDLVNGEYTITPVKEGYEFHPLPVTIDTTGEDIRGLNFTGLRIFNVTGRVTTTEGIGIEGVSITDNFGNIVLTDVNGDFVITGIPSGSYTFIAAKENYTFTPAWQYVDIGSDVPVTIIFVGSGL